MNRKIIFLDIDGTLVNIKGVIPESTRKALHMAKENGHLLFICSGRSRYQIHPELLALGFDGIVAAAGSHVIYRDQTLFHQFIEKDERIRLMQYLDENKFVYIIQTDTHPILNARCYQCFTERFERLGMTGRQIDLIMKGVEIREDTWNHEREEKVVYNAANLKLAQVMTDLAPYFSVTGSSLGDEEEGGEIGLASVNKATGMQVCFDHLGIDRTDSIAFGDGPNDMEMIQYAGIGVAMGNANDRLKDMADDVTASIDEDGIYRAFEKLQLI